MASPRLLVSVAALALCLAAMVSAVPREERVQRARSVEHRFEVTGSQPSLVVDNVIGRIRVVAGTSDRIVAHVEETVRARDATRAEAARREVELVPSQSGDRVRLYVDGPFREDWRTRDHRDPGYTVRYDFEIEVPPTIDLDLSTVTEGDLEVTGVGGELRLRHVDGAIRVRGASGHGTMETVNGGVEVAFVEPPDGDCRFETVNGDVRITLPDRTGAHLRLKSDFGELLSDFRYELVPTQAVVEEERADSGLRRYRVERVTEVRIGGGGPTLEMETLNGDVVVRRAGTSDDR